MDSSFLMNTVILQEYMNRFGRVDGGSKLRMISV